MLKVRWEPTEEEEMICLRKLGKEMAHLYLSSMGWWKEEIYFGILASQYITPYFLCLHLPIGKILPWRVMVRCEWESKKCQVQGGACAGAQQGWAPSDHSPSPTFHFIQCPVHTVILVHICYLVDLHDHGYDVCHNKKQGHWEPSCFNCSGRDLFLFLRTMNLTFGNLT